MSLTDLRQDLEHIRASAQAGNLDQVVQGVEHALHALDSSRLLTTTEAAEMLGIRSINTLKALVLRGGVPYERHGNRMMLPIAEVERLRESPLIHGLRASGSLHDSIAELGAPDGLTAEQMRDLAATRPGRLPWHGESAQDTQQEPEGTRPRSDRDASHA